MAGPGPPDTMPAVRTRVVLGASLAALVAGVALALGPPLLLVHNEGLVVRYAWYRAAGGFLVAVAFLALTQAVGSRVGRVLLVLCALAALGPASFLLRYRLELDAAGVSQREWLAPRRLAWADIRQVEPQENGIVIRGMEPPPMWIDTVGMRPADRAALDRNVTRRLQEAFAPPATAAR
jgi:hypothetical protein